MWRAFETGPSVKSMVSKSNSSGSVPFLERARYLRDLFLDYTAGAASADIAGLSEDFKRLDTYARSATKCEFAKLNAVEIGFGSKPYRIMYFCSRGVNAFGIDMDQPILKGSPAEFISIARKNGWLRAIKSFVRYWLFERKARLRFLDEIHTTVPDFVFDSKRLIVGDAGTPEPWSKIPVEPDLIYSIHVFEHIHPESLVWLLEFLHRRIRRNALLYIVITIWTGLIGGHLIEWGRNHLADKNKRSEPWEHLRRNRFPADTYLNKMTRRQYASLFAKYFDVLQDKPVWSNLGKEYLTDAVKRELLQFDEYELLSNDVCFVLRSKLT